MIIAIIADLHDNKPYLKAFLSSIESQEAEALLICGDTGNEDTFKTIAKKFTKPIYFVAGNADNFTSQDIPAGAINLGESGIIELANKKIGLCHEPYEADELLKNKPDIIFYGHTHQPWIEKKGNTLVVNPGTLGGVFMPSTFAIWDTDKPVPELIVTKI